MHVRNAYLANTFRNQDDMDGCPLIIGVGKVNVNDGYGYVVCFHLRYADGETKYIPITLTSLQKVTMTRNEGVLDSVRTENKRWKEMEMSKFLVVTFSDNSRWKVPAEFIAKDRAAYYAKLDSKRDGLDYDETYKDELDFTLNDEFELTDWASNNMNWSDVLQVASRLPDRESDHDYGKEWINAEMKAMELEE